MGQTNPYMNMPQVCDKCRTADYDDASHRTKLVALQGLGFGIRVYGLRVDGLRA